MAFLRYLSIAFVIILTLILVFLFWSTLKYMTEVKNVSLESINDHVRLLIEPSIPESDISLGSIYFQIIYYLSDKPNVIEIINSEYLNKFMNGDNKFMNEMKNVHIDLLNPGTNEQLTPEDLRNKYVIGTIESKSNEAFGSPLKSFGLSL